MNPTGGCGVIHSMLEPQCWSALPKAPGGSLLWAQWGIQFRVKERGDAEAGTQESSGPVGLVVHVQPGHIFGSSSCGPNSRGLPPGYLQAPCPSLQHGSRRHTRRSVAHDYCDPLLVYK